MLYKNLIYKISVVLIIAVLLLSGCSFLPEYQLTGRSKLMKTIAIA